MRDNRKIDKLLKAFKEDKVKKYILLFFLISCMLCVSCMKKTDFETIPFEATSLTDNQSTNWEIRPFFPHKTIMPSVGHTILGWRIYFLYMFGSGDKELLHDEMGDYYYGLALYREDGNTEEKWVNLRRPMETDYTSRPNFPIIMSEHDGRIHVLMQTDYLVFPHRSMHKPFIIYSPRHDRLVISRYVIEKDRKRYRKKSSCFLDANINILKVLEDDEGNVFIVYAYDQGSLFSHKQDGLFIGAFLSDIDEKDRICQISSKNPKGYNSVNADLKEDVISMTWTDADDNNHKHEIKIGDIP
jgi:hypothetical protein